MSEKLKWVTISDGIKNLFEIVAVLIAGIWAYYTFILKESPILYKTDNCETLLRIDSFDTSHILVEITAKIKNSSRQIISVDSVFVDYWLIPLDVLKNKEYFSPDDHVRFTPPTYSVKDAALQGKYAIEQQYQQVYQYVLEKDDSKMLIANSRFFINGSETSSKTKALPIYNYTYRIHCIPDKD